MPHPGSYQGKPLLSNHQKSWLWGTKTVWETLLANIWTPYELILSTSADQPIHEQCLQLASQQEIPIRYEQPARVQQLCGAKDHQGILALMGPFPYKSVDELLSSTERPQQSKDSIVLMLDQLQDPYNTGAIIRSAAAFGIDGIVIGATSQVGINSHVARSSVGTVNQIPIFKVENLCDTVTHFKQNGYQAVATEITETAIPVSQVRKQCDSPSRIVALIGNEAKGIRSELIELCDKTITIPMQGTAESLNAAVAAGIVLYELTR